MESKYRNGLKVRIIEVRDQNGHLKYPQIQEYINKTGIIVRGFVGRIDPTDKVKPFPSWVVHLDTGTETKIPIPEEALELLDK